MKLELNSLIYKNNKIITLLLALLGSLFILLSSNPYGAGLSPDSVGYIAVARNIIKGLGVISYDGLPLVVQPPLYPALLAVVGKLISTDPLLLAHIVNALLFGLIVYLGGRLTFQSLSSFPVLALIGTLAIAFSKPLLLVSVMAWSETLFICFVTLSLILAQSYIAKNEIISLILLSLSVALSCLTRYIGVTLILWGALIILLFYRNDLKNKIVHLSLFTFISALSLGLWLIRNIAISGTILGDRASSIFTLWQNLTFLFNRLLRWYIPYSIAKHESIVIMLIIFFAIFVALSAALTFRHGWQGGKIPQQAVISILLFVIIYVAFLVLSSTTVAYDRINDRFLSPIYVPLTLLLLILAQALLFPYRTYLSKKYLNSLILICATIWLAFLIKMFVQSAVTKYHTGTGYSSQSWIESQTIEYIVEHQKSESKCTIYSNAPDVLYILADLKSKISPFKTRYDSAETANEISTLSGSWPKESNVCLIWFDQISRGYLLTIEELEAVANIELIADLKDGMVYAITRK